MLHVSLNQAICPAPHKLDTENFGKSIGFAVGWKVWKVLEYSWGYHA